jgi:esterase/lipase
MIQNYLKLIARRAPDLTGDLFKDTVESFQFRPKSKNRPVLVIPGFTANDHSTLILRTALLSVGFKPYTWNQGTNLIASDQLLSDLLVRLESIYHENNNTPVTIIGWSMGGFYARALAFMNPKIVNSVITLGTPIKRDFDNDELREKYKKIGIDVDKYPLNQLTVENMKKTPVVPSSSIFSKADFLTPVNESQEIETLISENIEVETGHFGMVCDPEALKIIVNRCMEEKATWKRYDD